MPITEEQVQLIVKNLIDEYSKKGSIGSDALCDRIEKYDTDADQVDAIYKAMESNGIKIIDDYEKDKELYEQLLKEIEEI